MKKKILFIGGSLRKNSFNRQLAKKCATLIGERAELSFLEYADMPFMNQDAENPVPAAVFHSRKAMQNADGIWIFTPEYNAAIHGALKNLLDWLSRPLVAGDFSSGTAVMKKKVTISGAGGKNATRSADVLPLGEESVAELAKQADAFLGAL